MMNKQVTFKIDADADTDETSFHGIEVDASMDKMIRLFGQPTAGDPDDKVKHKWSFRGTAGYNISVYDYKYDGAHTGEWHVGATSADKARVFADWFKNHCRSNQCSSVNH
jgi:hypothetical protein